MGKKNAVMVKHYKNKRITGNEHQKTTTLNGPTRERSRELPKVPESVERLYNELGESEEGLRKVI